MLTKQNLTRVKSSLISHFLSLPAPLPKTHQTLSLNSLSPPFPPPLTFSLHCFHLHPFSNFSASDYDGSKKSCTLFLFSNFPGINLLPPPNYPSSLGKTTYLKKKKIAILLPMALICLTSNSKNNNLMSHFTTNIINIHQADHANPS